MSLVTRLDPWGPPVALMALIFFLSHQPDLSSGLGVWDLIGRKIVHALVFGALCFLFFRAVRTVTTPGVAVILAALLTLAYAVSDEIHQTFIEGRSGTARDVGIDALGIATAAAMARRRS